MLSDKVANLVAKLTLSARDTRVQESSKGVQSEAVHIPRLIDHVEHAAGSLCGNIRAYSWRHIPCDAIKVLTKAVLKFMLMQQIVPVFSDWRQMHLADIQSN